MHRVNVVVVTSKLSWAWVKLERKSRADIATAVRKGSKVGKNSNRLQTHFPSFHPVVEYTCSIHPLCSCFLSPKSSQLSSSIKCKHFMMKFQIIFRLKFSLQLDWIKNFIWKTCWNSIKSSSSEAQCKGSSEWRKEMFTRAYAQISSHSIDETISDRNEEYCDVKNRWKVNILSMLVAKKEKISWTCVKARLSSPTTFLSCNVTIFTL